MSSSNQNRPLLFCSIIAAIFIAGITIDRLAPIFLPLDAYFFRPWEYMMGSFRYNIPRTNHTMKIEGFGDLANMLGVPQYRVKRLYTWSNDPFGKRNASVTQNDHPDIVVVGDSFMASGADSDEESFVTQLQKRAAQSVYGYVPSDISLFLHDERFRNDPPKIVLWGRVERNTLGSNGEIETLLKDTSCFTEVSSQERYEKMAKDPVKKTIGNFVEYAQLSIIRRTMQQFLKAWVFALSGEHVKSVVLRSDGLMLFHDRGVALLSAPASARGFDHVADAVAHVRDCLQERGTRLVFMPIPDKEHIYASRLGKSIPSPDPLLVLDSALEEKNIDRVSLIERFQDESVGDLIYWPDDTHWNARGIGVAVEEVVKALQ